MPALHLRLLPLYHLLLRHCTPIIPPCVQARSDQLRKCYYSLKRMIDQLSITTFPSVSPSLRRCMRYVPCISISETTQHCISYDLLGTCCMDVLPSGHKCLTLWVGWAISGYLTAHDTVTRAHNLHANEAHHHILNLSVRYHHRRSHQSSHVAHVLLGHGPCH